MDTAYDISSGSGISMKSITRSAVTNAVMSPVDSSSKKYIDVDASSTKKLMNNVGDSVDDLAPRKAVINGSSGSLELNLQFLAKDQLWEVKCRFCKSNNKSRYYENQFSERSDKIYTIEG